MFDEAPAFRFGLIILFLFLVGIVGVTYLSTRFHFSWLVVISALWIMWMITPVFAGVIIRTFSHA
jgi:hypothetical protein